MTIVYMLKVCALELHNVTVGYRYRNQYDMFCRKEKKHYGR